MSINTNTNMTTSTPAPQGPPRNPFVAKMNIFNEELLAEPEKVPFMKYFIKARRECFSQIMFNFMGYFLALTTKEELFCVPHTKLREYGVINTDRSNDILTCLQKFGLSEESNDFTVRNVPQRGKSGATYRKVYTLTQDAFKLCLMRAKNSRQFANYYLMLEKVIGFHQKYLDSYTKRVIAFKDEKIDEQTSKIDQLQCDMRRMLERTDHVITQNNGLQTQNNSLITKVDEVTVQNNTLIQKVIDITEHNEFLEDEVAEVKYELKDTSARLDAVESHLDQRNIPPENPILSHEFVLIKMPGTETHDEYTVIRGQKKTVHQKIKSIPKGTTVTILHKELEPNPIDAFNRLKDEIKSFNFQVIQDIMKMKASKQRTQQKRDYRASPAVSVKNTTISLKKNNNYFNEETLVAMLTDLLDEKYEIEVKP